MTPHLPGLPAIAFTQVFADFVAGFPRERIPPEVLQVARQCVLDCVACTIAAAGEPATRVLLQETVDQGGHPHAQVFGTALRCSVPQAALVNGTMAHLLDYDDVHLLLPGHPSAPVVPAVLALAERHGLAGGRVLEAVAIAIELECRLGQWLGPTHYATGWSPAGTLGTLAASAAACRLLQLDPARTAMAIGLAATQAGGLRSMTRTEANPFNSGRAAASGVHAAQLVARGFNAPGQALEARHGLAQVFQTTVADTCTQGLGQHWYMLDTLFKYHVSCYGAHPAIEAARALLRDVPLAGEQCASVEVEVSRFVHALCVVDEPGTSPEMKLSIPQNVAMALAAVDTGSVDSYSTDLLRDTRINGLRARVQVVCNAALADFETELRCVLHDGSIHVRRMLLSEPLRDLDEQDTRLANKFRRLADPILGTERARRALDLFTNLDALPSISPLARACAVPGDSHFQH